jgi:gamma-carbonic anhydrase
LVGEEAKEIMMHLSRSTSRLRNPVSYVYVRPLTTGRADTKREACCTDIRSVAFRKSTPQVSDLVTYISPTATLIGRLSVGSQTTIGINSILRADVNTIDIGDGSVIQDNVMVHCSGTLAQWPTRIGNNVLVESGCIIHGCTIHDGAVVEAGSQVLDGAIIHSGARLLAGSMLSSRKVVKENELWGGFPAKKIRVMDDSDRALSSVKLSDAVSLGLTYKAVEAETEKPIAVASGNKQ